MKITYSNNVDFYDGVLALVQRGITFNADHENLVIILTGGF